jgi:hypothetical protein
MIDLHCIADAAFGFRALRVREQLLWTDLQGRVGPSADRTHIRHPDHTQGLS